MNRLLCVITGGLLFSALGCGPPPAAQAPGGDGETTGGAPGAGPGDDGAEATDGEGTRLVELPGSGADPEGRPGDDDDDGDQPAVAHAASGDESGVPTGLAGILAAHNKLRAQHCAPPLAWSPQIAKVAQHWADHLAGANCAFNHSHGRYGENLAAGSPGAMTNYGVVEYWYREIDKYDFAHGGFSMDTGHFTQVVWRGTTQIGCGTTTCGGFQLWVCNYDPPGNMQGEYQQNVLPPDCAR